MKIFPIFLALIYAAMPNIVPAIAEEQNWEFSKSELKNIDLSKMVPDEKCDARWDIIWPWAKKGNLEARSLILNDMFFNGRELPGSSGDTVSKYRDVIIISVHSVGVGEDKAEAEAESLKEFPRSIYKIFEQEPYRNGKRFYECAAKNWVRECANLAVEDKLVPSFEKFSEQIDSFALQGQKSICLYREQ